MFYSNKDLRKLILPLLVEQLLIMLVGMVDTVITELERFPPEAMPPALTAGKLKHALETAEDIFLDEDPEDA